MRARRLASNLLLLGASATAALLLAEGGLRAFGLASPIIYRPDSTFGFEPKPSQASRRLGVQVHINDVGLRDDESLAELMQSDERILVVGNSVTYGSSLVSQAETWPEVLERELRTARPGIKIMNGGVAGYSVTQMAKRAPRLVKATAPHYLVLYVIRDDFRRAPMHIPRDSPQQPLKPPPSALGIFIRLSLGFVNSRYGIRERLPQELLALWPRGGTSFVPPYDTSRLTDLHFEAVDQFVRTSWEAGGRNRSRVVVFISPSRGQLLENDAGRNADLVERFSSIGIRVYDLHGDFYNNIVAAGEDIGDYYHDPTHYRKRGNALAGRVLARHLTRDVLKPPTSAAAARSFAQANGFSSADGPYIAGTGTSSNRR